MNPHATMSFLGAVGFAVFSMAANAAALPGPVVSAQWLHDHASEVTVLDVRSDLDGFTAAPEYKTDEKGGGKKLVAAGGHIEGALLVDFNKIRADRTIEGKTIQKMLPDKAAFEAVMQTAGLGKDKPVVVTSNGEAIDELQMATRLYWSLKYYGVTDMAVLDGGNAAWLAADYPVSLDKPKITQGDWVAKGEHREILAETADVEKALKGKTQFVDARPMAQYLGLVYKKPAVTAGGHLPGARDLSPDLTARPVGVAQQFLSADEYRAVMKAQGINPKAAAITYCNTGHMASATWFIQSEILGNKAVRLYDGSMHEWTTLGRPVVALAK